MIKIVRIFFLLLVAVVAYTYLTATNSHDVISYIILAGSMTLALVTISADILIKKKNLSVLSGVMFGLVVGMSVSVGIGYRLPDRARSDRAEADSR